MAIEKCNNAKCKSDFQDQTYGAGMRVMNPRTKDSGMTCTNCGTVKGGTFKKK